jgi:hypothetical protein
MEYDRRGPVGGVPLRASGVSPRNETVWVVPALATHAAAGKE